MSGVRHWYQRRPEKKYVPRRRQWTPEERLSRLEEIAERAERGDATRLDEIEAAAHMAALSPR